jgi:hypothetical protein
MRMGSIDRTSSSGNGRFRRVGVTVTRVGVSGVMACQRVRRDGVTACRRDGDGVWAIQSGTCWRQADQ